MLRPNERACPPGPSFARHGTRSRLPRPIRHSMPISAALATACILFVEPSLETMFFT